MRIISKFHDYYDCIMREGMDLTQVWVREAVEYDCNPRSTSKHTMEWPLPNCRFVNHGRCYRRSSNERYRWQYVIGFCGKIYPMVKLKESWLVGHEPEPKAVLCWTIEEVEAYYHAHLSRGELERYNGRYSRWSGHGSKHSYREFFEECEKKKESHSKLFLEHNTPVFVGEQGPYRSRVTFNASLKDVNFVTQFDPYQAFQEIQMYFGSALSGSDGHKIKYKGQMVETNVDDKTKAELRGFDKLSFKNQKHPSKPRKTKK